MRAVLPFLVLLAAMLAAVGGVVLGARFDERLKQGTLLPTHVGSVSPKFGSAAR